MKPLPPAASPAAPGAPGTGVRVLCARPYHALFMHDIRAGPPGPGREARPRPGPAAGRRPPDRGREPCLRCGFLLAVRAMGCRGGRCPNCAFPHPHGDCSD